MTKKEYPKPVCRSCGGENLDLIISFGETTLADRLVNRETELVTSLGTGDRLLARRIDKRVTDLEPIRGALERPGDPWMRWRYSLHVRDGFARLALARRDPERALTLIAEELEGARTHRARKLEARALELRGRTLVTVGRPREAQDTL